MLFLNTRPPDRAASLTQQLEAAQIQVIELPLLELIEQPYSDQLANLYKALPQVQLIVVVSPTAVQIGMQYLKQSGLALADLSHIQWIAVGKATEQALLKYGVQSHVPQVETSEGMLALPILEQLQQGTKIAFWRGDGGRVFMMDHLIQLKMNVLNFVLYKRRCPSSAKEVLHESIQTIEQASHVSVLISSEASWVNWLDLVKSYPKVLQKAYYLVLGGRLAAIVGDYQQQHHACLTVIEMKDLRQETILQQLAHVQGMS